MTIDWSGNKYFFLIKCQAAIYLDHEFNPPRVADYSDPRAFWSTLEPARAKGGHFVWEFVSGVGFYLAPGHCPGHCGLHREGKAWHGTDALSGGGNEGVNSLGWTT